MDDHKADAGTRTDAHPPGAETPSGRPGRRLRRLTSALLGVAAVAGLLFVAQQFTGFLCGATVPGFGEVGCGQPSRSDLTGWMDDRTSYLQAETAFGHQKALCDTAGIAVGEEASATGYGRCLREEYGPYRRAGRQLQTTGTDLLVSLDEGPCRVAVVRWRRDLDDQLELAKLASSGTVDLTASGQLPDHVVAEWNRLQRAEVKGASAVVAACER